MSFARQVVYIIGLSLCPKMTHLSELDGQAISRRIYGVYSNNTE